MIDVLKKLIASLENKPELTEAEKKELSSAKAEIEKLEKDETTFISKDELNKRITEELQKEKDKLYSSLEHSKNDAKKSRELIESLKKEQDKIREEAEKKARKEAEEEYKKKLESMSDYERIQEEMKQKEIEYKKKFEENNKTLKSLQELLEIEQKERKEALLKAELSEYTRQQIAAAGGRIIQELVQGNTKEQIDASIELAKQKYEEYQLRAKEELMQVSDKNAAVPTAGHNTRASKDDDVNPTYTATEIQRMSPEERAEYRRRIMAKGIWKP